MNTNEKVRLIYPPATSTAELKCRFMARAEAIVDEFFDLAFCKDPSYRTQSIEAKHKIFDALVPILQKAGDNQAIQAETGADVIKALGKGQITVDEALKLMTMLRTQSEAEVLPALEAKLATMKS